MEVPAGKPCVGRCAKSPELVRGLSESLNAKGQIVSGCQLLGELWMTLEAGRCESGIRGMSQLKLSTSSKGMELQLQSTCQLIGGILICHLPLSILSLSLCQTVGLILSVPKGDHWIHSAALCSCP